MGLLENGIAKFGTAAAVGIGAIVLAPAVIPLISAAGRPLMKVFAAGGSALCERGSKAFAGSVRALEELMAEARHELAEERRMKTQGLSSQEETVPAPSETSTPKEASTAEKKPESGEAWIVRGY